MNKHSAFAVGENFDGSQLLNLQGGLNKRTPIAVLDARVAAAIQAALDAIAIPPAVSQSASNTYAGEEGTPWVTVTGFSTDLTVGWRYELQALVRLMANQETATLVSYELEFDDVSLIRGWVFESDPLTAASQGPDSGNSITLPDDQSFELLRGTWIMDVTGEDRFLQFNVKINEESPLAARVECILIARPISLIPEP